MKENFSINYFFASEAIRDLIFEEWEKFNILLQKGPEILKEYFCKLWNETLNNLEEFNIGKYLGEINSIVQMKF